MSTNEGNVDRMLRIGMGFVLLSLTILGPKTWWGVVGLVPLITGYLGFCPLYHLFGISSCPVPPPGAKRGPVEKPV